MATPTMVKDLVAYVVAQINLFKTRAPKLLCVFGTSALWVNTVCKVVAHLVHTVIDDVSYWRGATFQKACKKRGAVQNVNVVLSSWNPKEIMPEIKPAV